MTFLTACRISPAHQRPYLTAYQRITNNLHTRPAPPRPRPGARAARPAAVPLSHSLSPEERLAAVKRLGDLFGHAARDARRNGTFMPHLNDLEADLYAITDDNRVLAIQVKDYRNRARLPTQRESTALAAPTDLLRRHGHQERGSAAS